MVGAYKWKKLSDCNINDQFFDSLKSDYPEFEKWYLNKAYQGKKAFTYSDEKGLGAFVMLKPNEKEVIKLKNDIILPKRQRLKISTLKLSKRVQGNRLGEGAIGIALWEWLESDDEEIYVTVFDKHEKLIKMLEKFGFEYIGDKLNGEGLYLKSKNHLNFSNPYLSFPFISKKQSSFALLPIRAKWHDKLFPYSELKNTKQETEEFAAANGMTKTYIAFPKSTPIYEENQPVLIYRIHSDEKGKTYKSVITSYGTIVKCTIIKRDNKAYCSYEEYANIVGNKSVFTKEEISSFYKEKMYL